MIQDDSIPRDYSLASISSSVASQQDEYYQSADHAESTLRNMQTYLDSRQLCDVVLVAGNDGKK